MKGINAKKIEELTGLYFNKEYFIVCLDDVFCTYCDNGTIKYDNRTYPCPVCNGNLTYEKYVVKKSEIKGVKIKFLKCDKYSSEVEIITDLESEVYDIFETEEEAQKACDNLNWCVVKE